MKKKPFLIIKSMDPDQIRVASKSRLYQKVGRNTAKQVYSDGYKQFHHVSIDQYGKVSNVEAVVI